MNSFSLKKNKKVLENFIKNQKNLNKEFKTNLEEYKYNNYNNNSNNNYNNNKNNYNPFQVLNYLKKKKSSNNTYFNMEKKEKKKRISIIVMIYIIIYFPNIMNQKEEFCKRKIIQHI